MLRSNSETLKYGFPNIPNYWLQSLSFAGQKKEGSEGITVVYRSMWKLAKGKKMEVAMKVLKHENCEKYLKVSNNFMRY